MIPVVGANRVVVFPEKSRCQFGVSMGRKQLRDFVPVMQGRKTSLETPLMKNVRLSLPHETRVDFLEPGKISDRGEKFNLFGRSVPEKVITGFATRLHDIGGGFFAGRSEGHQGFQQCFDGGMTGLFPDFPGHIEKFVFAMRLEQ